MSRGAVRVGRWVALLAAISLVGAVIAPAASAQQDEEFPAVDQPGVTDTEINVGGIVTEEGSPTGAQLTSAFDGVKAYFEYINKTEGGVYGRDLVLSSERDDRLGNNRSEVEGLLAQDDVFAALPIAVQLFTGADLLADAGIPTFGWDINAEWGSEDLDPGPPNFFGSAGSFICFACGEQSLYTWLPKELDRHKVGVLAFAVPQSEGCVAGIENSLEKYPTAKVVFADKSIVFGSPDYTSQVAEMKKQDVDLVMSCIDGNGAVNLAREMQKQQLDAIQVLPNLYNHELVSENADVLEGDYLFTQFAPFETKPKPEGLKLYEKWIKETDGRTDENSMVGWINADQFVEGLKAAGPDFTQEKVVDAINAETDFTAKGLLAGVDWTTAHENEYDCYAVLQVKDGKFKPVFGEKGKPFSCFDPTAKKVPAKPEVK
jgi:ABC-type branched-subunit amino acid transport system substrate-binding protein